MPPEFTPPTECPVCGEDVPRNAKACPGCGADERSGWNEAATRYDGLDLPDEAYNETNTPLPRSPSGLIRNITIVVMIVALLFLFVF
jgi:hypothetical protein